MGITAERIKRITEQAAAMKAIGKASVDVSGELDALVSENELMEAEIQSLEEANARLRERLNRGENHDAYMKLPLDAYGEPIRMGDVVNVDGDAMTVLGYRRDDTLLLIAKDRKSGLFFSPEPSRVRHFKLEPPDSWEKLEEDANKTVCGYVDAPLDEDGLTTCEGCRFEHLGECHYEMTRDVLKRAKKLAGIEEEEQR